MRAWDSTVYVLLLLLHFKDLKVYVCYSWPVNCCCSCVKRGRFFLKGGRYVTYLFVVTALISLVRYSSHRMCSFIVKGSPEVLLLLLRGS